MPSRLQTGQEFGRPTPRQAPINFEFAAADVWDDQVIDVDVQQYGFVNGGQIFHRANVDRMAQGHPSNPVRGHLDPWLRHRRGLGHPAQLFRDIAPPCPGSPGFVGHHPDHFAHQPFGKSGVNEIGDVDPDCFSRPLLVKPLTVQVMVGIDMDQHPALDACVAPDGVGTVMLFDAVDWTGGYGSVHAARMRTGVNQGRWHCCSIELSK